MTRLSFRFFLMLAAWLITLSKNQMIYFIVIPDLASRIWIASQNKKFVIICTLRYSTNSYLLVWTIVSWSNPIICYNIYCTWNYIWVAYSFAKVSRYNLAFPPLWRHVLYLIEKTRQWPQDLTSPSDLNAEAPTSATNTRVSRRKKCLAHYWEWVGVRTYSKWAG